MIFHIDNITQNTFESVRNAYDEGIRDFSFHIDSNGGSLDAALRIYDLLRSDAECKVSASVEGACISAATVILCTAPVERRMATKNSAFLIHSPILPVMQDVNKKGADQIKADIDSAYHQLQSLYLDRTSIGDSVSSYMDSEKTFFADEALALGFIGSIKEMYNQRSVNHNSNTYHNNRMRNIKNLIQNILMQLKNEKFVLKDGTEFEALSLEVGSPVDGLEDGVYELADGAVITVDKGVIVDVIPAKAVEEEKKEESALENEGEGTAEGAEAPEGCNPEVEEKKEEAAAELEKAAEDVAEAVSVEEINKIVEEAVEALKEEIIAKYKPMAEIINSLGGLERLKALQNTQPQKKTFETKKKVESSLEVLLNRVNKRN